MKPNTQTRQRYYQKQKLEADIFDEYGCKNLNEILTNRIQQHIKMIIHHNQGGFIPISHSKVIHHINKRNVKSHTVISADAEKAFGKIHHPVVIKNLPKWVWREHISTQ